MSLPGPTRVAAWLSFFRQRSLLLVFFVALLLLPTAGASANFTQCLSDIQQGKYGSNPGAVDEYGDPITNIPTPTAILAARDPTSSINLPGNTVVAGLTYRACVKYCGAGPDAFSWSIFSQEFSAWLLPWLALLSQLPFGAKQRVDDLLSVALAVGSPTLAAYSLTLTILNGRYVARKFSGIKYPNALCAFQILNSLQQAALGVNPNLVPSLVVLPENDEWWKELAERVDFVHTWSIAAGASIAWVLLAYLFTVIDSFTTLATSSDPTASPGVSDGQAVGSVWLWLLAVVVGWLQMSPKCDDARLRAAMLKSNTYAYVARDGGEPVKASILSEENAIFLFEERQGDNHDGARDDEMASAPIYNYARFLPWSQHVEIVAAAFRNANVKAQLHKPADGSNEWHQPERNDIINPCNRKGTYSQLDWYCADPSYVRRSRWGPHIISRFILSAIAALLLQWGTVGASIIILWFTPTKGMGCRSASYLLYASLSTFVWMILVTSSALVHASAPLDERGTRRALIRQLATVLRRIGKMLATANALWIVTSCVLQFSNLYDACFCNVQLKDMVLHTWNKAYDIMVIQTDLINGLRAPWAGGVALGMGCAVCFVLFVNLYMNPLP